MRTSPDLLNADESIQTALAVSTHSGVRFSAQRNVLGSTFSAQRSRLNAA